jgi:hypothetical protein
MHLRNQARTASALTVMLCLAGPPCALKAGSPVIGQDQVTKHEDAAKKSSAPASDEGEDCVDCHSAEVNGFARSKMSQSMRVPSREPEGLVQIPSATIRVHSDRDGTWQILESHDQSEKYRVDYVIGSGTHASGYLVTLDNHLFQSPVAYYRRQAAYGLAPGYEHTQDPDFTRPVKPGCLFCHSGSFTPISGTENNYAAKPFSNLAISCSRCHGPVDAHLAHPGRSNIINPARLEPAARDSICEQCHLKGVVRVPNPGKTFSDFAPGQPLENTFTIYRYVMPEGMEPPFKVISHSEQLALSLCKRASGSKLWCGTCHNPHNPTNDPVSYYRSRCLGCHSETHFASDHPSKESDCIGCHMPKKEANDGGHTVFTDHRIQRTMAEKPSGAPKGIVPWRDPVPELAKRNLGIALVDAGMEEGSWPQIVSGYRTLTAVQGQFSQDSEMFSAMGNALFIGHQYEEATAAFELAVRFEPKSSADETSLGSAYAAQGKNDLAEAHLERALELDALNLNAAELLIGLYEKDGKAARAAAIRNKIEGLIH